MELERELAIHRILRPMLLTIGVFDGVHLGHRHLLEHLVMRAGEKGCLAGVVTFKTHPEKVLNRSNSVPWICTLQERIRLLKGAGVDVVVPITFTREVADMEPRSFIMLLKRYLKMCDMVLGPDFALGRHRKGDPDYLRDIGQELDFRVELVKPARLGDEVISSSAIRRCLAEGDVIRVSQMLGRYFSLDGRVVTGDRRGRTLGFPTANLNVRPEQAMPADGIYATIAHFGGRSMAAVTNIGVRPTFRGHRRLIETYIMDYDGDIYRKKLKVELVARLRDEIKFASVDALKAQMKIDAETARQILLEKGVSS